MNHERFAFIIRIWFEAEPEFSQMRGSIQLVSSTEKVYFSSLDEVPDLLHTIGQFPEIKSGENEKNKGA